MKELPKQHIRWFEAKRTTNWRGQSADPFVESGIRMSRRWNRCQALVFIASSFLLFWMSFSPAWGNPNTERLPNHVLIPIDKVINGEEEEGDRSSSESKVESQESENHVHSQQQEQVVAPAKDEKSEEATEKKQQPSSSNDSKTVTPQQKKESGSQQADTSDVRTENGGTLPDTATPFGTILVRGLALVLLGMGLRLWAKERD